MKNGVQLYSGAELVNPAGESGRLDILVKNGIVEAMAHEIRPPSGCICHKLDGKIIFPALIDLHVHLREPGQSHKEDIRSGTRAALKGGFATIAAMPNTMPVMDSVEQVQWLSQRGREEGINILPVPALSRGLMGTELNDLEALARAGAVAFSDDGKSLADSSLMRQALIRCRDLSRPVFQHSEDPLLAQRGQVDPRALSLFDYPLEALPASAEEAIIARDIALQHETGGHLHVTHLSSAYAAEMIAWAKERGQRVSADVTPHHLLLNFQALAEYGSLAKMKPPLRGEEDRQRLIRLLADGTIDCVATDHAPHSPAEKNGAFTEAPFGIIGMETAFPLLYDRLVRNGELSLSRLVAVFTSEPAKLIGQEKSLGLLAPGLPASMVVFNPQADFAVDMAFFCSKSRNSPFIGWRGFGVIEETIVAGRRYSQCGE